MQRSKRASVESQVNLQPLLLAAATIPSTSVAMAGMSRVSESSSTRSSKRDSAFSDIVGSFPISSGNLRRMSLKKHSQIDSPSESETLSPIYRLYPHQTANGSKRLRAMEDRPDLAYPRAHQSSIANDNTITDINTRLSQSPQQQHARQFAQLQPAPEDDVFEVETASREPLSATATDDSFLDHSSLPTSRSESRDSFVTPLSGNSRAATPDLVQQDHHARHRVRSEAPRPSDREHSVVQERHISLQDLPSQQKYMSLQDLPSQLRSIVRDQRSARNPSQDRQSTRIQSAQDQYSTGGTFQDRQSARLNSTSQDQRSDREPSQDRQSTRHSIIQDHQHRSSDRFIDQQSTRHSIIQDRSSTREQSQDRRSNTRNRSVQERRTLQESSPQRGRSALETYVPKGYRSSNHSIASSRVSMGLHKVSSSGQIADIDDDIPGTPETMTNRMYGVGDRSSAESVFSQETTATSLNTLPPLQSKGPDSGDAQQLEPLLEDDPRSFDLVEPASADEPDGVYALEKRAELMFGEKHLQAIFDDPKLLMKFTSFLNIHRPHSIPLLIYYLDSLKAIRAIKYANAIAEALDPINGQEFTKNAPSLTNNTALERKANEAFRVLTDEDLPAYIAYVWIQVVSVSIQRRITGTLAPHLREASEGLAETFCLSDPSRKDNPIVFASEEFARTTQYGMTYAIGRNCRFLQGPQTNPNSVRRLAMACKAGEECNEVFVNYRRDGSPFLNLLLIAPLMDSHGEVRYYIGAQVDVSGLLKGCNELPALASLVEKEQNGRTDDDDNEDRDEFQELAEMFNSTELNTVRRHGGRMHQEYVDDSDGESIKSRQPRMVLKDTAQDVLEDDVDKHRESSVPAAIKEKINGKLDGVYQHYLLVRPAPSLRILFTSPSLRVPGILQSPFLHRIGGSARVRNDLASALAEGRGVTAKIRWLFRADEDGEGEGRARWIHCTPLLGHSGSVGVWMVVLVEEEGFVPGNPAGRRFRQAPPVASNIGGKEWTNERTKEQKRPATGYTADLDNARRGGSVAAVRASSRPGRSYSIETAHDNIERRSSTAPSPDVPRIKRSEVNAIDFEDRPKSTGRGAHAFDSRQSSYTSNHLVHQIAGGRSGKSTKGHSNASVFSLDLN